MTVREQEKAFKKFFTTPKNIRGTAGEFKRRICGKKLNWGKHREVYEYGPWPDRYVVKLEHGTEMANVLEYKVWEYMAPLCGKYQPVKDAFAPCSYMVLKPDITFLLQRRITFKAKKSEYPKKVFNFFTDLKIQNFGWLDDEFVCCDYSAVFYRAFSYGGITLKMRTVPKWHSDHDPKK